MLDEIGKKVLGQKDSFDYNSNSCNVCFISCLPILPCKCNICEDCIFNWIATKNFEILFTKEQYFKCPNKICLKEISINWLSQNLNTKNFRCLNQILLKKYINTACDTRKCPNKFCTYVGWVDTSKRCSDLVQCELCLSSWIDYSIISYSFFHKLILYLKNLRENVRNDLSEFVVLLIYKSCPFCGIRIYKMEGCDHIICSNCKEEFCYNCTTPYHDHDQNLCLSKFFVIAIMAFFIIFFILLKMIYSLRWLWLPLYYIFFFTGFNLISAGFIFVNCLVMSNVLNLFCTRNSLIYLFMFGVHAVSLVYFYLVNDFLFMYANYFIGEIITLAAIGGLVYCAIGRRFENLF